MTPLPLTLTQPFAHQAKIIEETRDRRYWGLFMEQGTGKTHVTIATFVHLYRNGLINGVLILAPNGVHDNWIRNEIPIHCPLHNPDDMLTATWHSNKSQRTWDWCANSPDMHKLVVLAANIEAVRVPRFRESIGEFIQKRKFLLIVDESTVIKNPKADQTKAVIKLAEYATYKRILTGTPITQSPLDLWAQCRTLSPDAIPYPSFTAFKHEFAVEQILNFGHRAFRKVVGYQNQDRLAAYLAKFTTRILKKDCLDLPDKLYQIRYVELTDEQKRVYRDLMKQSLAMIDPGMVTVTTAITMILRLQQVTLGYVPSDDGTILKIPHRRIQALGTLLDEMQGKAIIFVRFLEDISQIRQLLSDRGLTVSQWVEYSGSTTQEQRHRAVTRFQEDESCRFFVATNAASRGLTLTAATNVVYYSQGYSLETRLQSEDRAHRIGQDRNVLYTDFIAQGTVDERIIMALREKKELADCVLDKARLAHLLELQETS